MNLNSICPDHWCVKCREVPILKGRDVAISKTELNGSSQWEWEIWMLQLLWMPSRPMFPTWWLSLNRSATIMNTRMLFSLQAVDSLGTYSAIVVTIDQSIQPVIYMYSKIPMRLGWLVFPVCYTVTCVWRSLWTCWPWWTRMPSPPCSPKVAAQRPARRKHSPHGQPGRSANWKTRLRQLHHGEWGIL